jgi:hypothetical protein
VGHVASGGVIHALSVLTHSLVVMDDPLKSSDGLRGSTQMVRFIHLLPLHSTCTVM